MGNRMNVLTATTKSKMRGSSREILDMSFAYPRRPHTEKAESSSAGIIHFIFYLRTLRVTCGAHKLRPNQMAFSP